MTDNFDPAPPLQGTGGSSADVSALRTRISELERQNSELQASQAGARRLAAEKDKEVSDLRAQLGSVNQLLDSSRAELDTVKQTGHTTQEQLAQAQADAKKATRMATVLQLAGQVDPALVRVISGGQAQIQVPGETPEEITSNLQGMLSQFKSLFNQPGAPAQPLNPGTPSVGGSSSTPPNVPGTSREAILARMSEIRTKLFEISRDPYNSHRSEVEPLDTELASLDKQLKGLSG